MKKAMRKPPNPRQAAPKKAVRKQHRPRKPDTSAKKLSRRRTAKKAAKKK